MAHLLIDESVTDLAWQENVRVEAKGLVVQEVAEGPFQIMKAIICTEGHQGLWAVRGHLVAVVVGGEKEEGRGGKGGNVKDEEQKSTASFFQFPALGLKRILTRFTLISRTTASKQKKDKSELSKKI